MKLMDNILQITYKKDYVEFTKSVHIQNYNNTAIYNASINDLLEAFSYTDGTRNSMYEVDRYIANRMMIIFDNIQEILRNQSRDIFKNSEIQVKNQINILGYYAGYIRFSSNIPDMCEPIREQNIPYDENDDTFCYNFFERKSDS